MPGKARHRGLGGRSPGIGRSGQPPRGTGSVKWEGAQALLGEEGSHQCQGWKNLAAGGWFPFKLCGSTLVLKKHSQTLQNFHLCLTSHVHLTHWRKTKTTISRKFLQGALRQQGHNCAVSCCLPLCLTATSTSLLSFKFFFFSKSPAALP